jgi:tetratricopeptide (TPR) repeat protein
MGADSLEDSGGLGEDSIDIAAMCAARGWSRARLISAMRHAAAVDGLQLPGDDSLKRMIRLWVNGERQPSDGYASLLARTFGVAQVQAGPDSADRFLDLISRMESSVDKGLVDAFENQTQSLRVLDRRLGARRLLSQSEAHAQNVADLVQWAEFGSVRNAMAATGAEAAALAGWQALDLGKPSDSWRLHNLARSLAVESGDSAIVAHVTAQQAYALLDAGKYERAVKQFEAARRMAGTDVAAVVRAWLLSAEAEARAAAGESSETLRLLDEADNVLDGDDSVPFIFLNSAHLARWRGHSMARLGRAEAVEVLKAALDQLDPEFNRAAAGLHVDLATAYSVAGEEDAAQHHAQCAASLSDSTGSHRQRVRIETLLNAKGKKVQ